MLATNYTSLRNNLKSYCDLACEGEDYIIVTRKQDKNIAIMSMETLNDLLRQARNAEYLAKIDRGYNQLMSGEGKAHELIEVDDE